MNLQTILMIFFFQRGRWVRMVGKEKKKSWGTSTETLKPPNMLCLTRTRSLPSVSEIVQHPVGNTSSHAIPAGKTPACTSRQTAAEGHPAQTADTAVDFMLCQYSFLQPPLSAPGGLQKQGCPGTIYYSCNHYPEW